MNIPSNGFPINTGVPLPFAPPPPGAAATFPAPPSDSWTPSAPPTAAPAYQPAFQTQAPPQAQPPARDENYQFACFRPENWSYPSTLHNNTYTPAGTTANTDPRLAMMRQRDEAHMQNRRNMSAGWNNYSRNLVDPNRGPNGQGGYNNGQYGNGTQYGNGYNNNNPGSYLYGNPGGRRNQNFY